MTLKLNRWFRSPSIRIRVTSFHLQNKSKSCPLPSRIKRILSSLRRKRNLEENCRYRVITFSVKRGKNDVAFPSSAFIFSSPRWKVIVSGEKGNGWRSNQGGRINGSRKEGKGGLGGNNEKESKRQERSERIPASLSLLEWRRVGQSAFSKATFTRKLLTRVLTVLRKISNTVAFVFAITSRRRLSGSILALFLFFLYPYRSTLYKQICVKNKFLFFQV